MTKGNMPLPPPGSAPVLSTPDTHIFDQVVPQVDALNLSKIDNEQIYVHYEIQRTVDEIRRGRWKRIALQFPDHMLVDAPRVFQALSRGLNQARKDIFVANTSANVKANGTEPAVESQSTNDPLATPSDQDSEKLFVLADTSYGACCVDEIAAEHADADVVVHYGRSCLSPTARLPVIYVFTNPPLDLNRVTQAFKHTYPNKHEKIILIADIPYSRHLSHLATLLKSEGYSELFVTSIVHDTASALPNRSVPAEVEQDASLLGTYRLFHISDPPPSLLLTLSSRVAEINIFPTKSGDNASTNAGVLLANSTAALRRRYALLTRVSNVPIIGILINTLSVRSYLDMLRHIKSMIAASGKKSYTFVVGKVNAAKIANFSEVGGWVVIGCWESSLFDSADFWKPVITPWELEVALKGDKERLWTGTWSSDYNSILPSANDTESELARVEQDEVATSTKVDTSNTQLRENGLGEEQDTDSEEESEPPEFDLRSGRYVSHTRPMGGPQSESRLKPDNASSETSLVHRSKRDVATIGGQVSPAADFFRNQRSWQGLGSDFEVQYEQDGTLIPQDAATVEQGRSGIARGYVTEGTSSTRR